MIAVNIVMFLLCFFIEFAVARLGFHYGWWKDQGHFNWDDIGVALIAGSLLGISNFSYFKKKLLVNNQEIFNKN